MTQDITLIAPLPETPYQYREGRLLADRLAKVPKIGRDDRRAPYTLSAGERVDYRAGRYVTVR